MTTLAIVVIVAIVALLAGGIGAYAGAMIAAGTIAIKLSEVTKNANDRTRSAKPTNSVP